MHGKVGGEQLLLLGTLLAGNLARGRTLEEVELLAAFFTVLGDNLALLLVTRPENSCVTENT